MEQKKTQKFHFLLKIIIIGDSGVGKTNLITRFCQNKFKQSYVSTIGVDFKIKTLTMNNKRYKMQIWDTAGQQRFKHITQTYYKGAAGIILTYSITDRQSFQNVEKWIAQIQNNAPSGVRKILLATKRDLTQERTVEFQQGKELADLFGMKFMEVSTKTSFNVNQSFEMLVQEIHNKYQTKGQFQGMTAKRKILIGRKTQGPHDITKCKC